MNVPLPLKWEQIDDFHQRAKVIGGWLVKAYESVCTGERGVQGYEWRVAMTFVPDEWHSWGL